MTGCKHTSSQVSSLVKIHQTKIWEFCLKRKSTTMKYTGVDKIAIRLWKMERSWAVGNWFSRYKILTQQWVMEQNPQKSQAGQHRTPLDLGASHLNTARWKDGLRQNQRLLHIPVSGLSLDTRPALLSSETLTFRDTRFYWGHDHHFENSSHLHVEVCVWGFLLSQPFTT